MTPATAGDRAGLAGLGLRTWAAAGADPAARAQVEGSVAAMFAAADLERPDPPAYGRLAEIRAPTVLVLGDLDYPMVTTCADSIAACIPGCRQVAPGAGHLLPLRPGLIADVIRQHVARPAPAATQPAATVLQPPSPAVTARASRSARTAAPGA